MFRTTWSPPPVTAISAFLPIRSEPDLRPLLHDLQAAGHVIGLPCVIARREPLLFRRWTPGLTCESGPFGIPEPPASTAEIQPDWLLVPLLAYDREGYRLGYGGGFYDLTLAALRRQRRIFAIGVAFDGQEVGTVPHGPNDERLDAIMTEKRIITVGA